MRRLPAGREGDGSMADPGPDLYQKSLKPRAAREIFGEAVYRPLAHLVVRLLLRTPVRPEHLVLFQGVLAAAAAYLLWQGVDGAAAVLLLLRNVFDAADGQLARARGEASQLGRYLDTEVDLLSNFLLFFALGLRLGNLPAALLAFVLLTLLLSADYAANSPKALPPRRGPEPWAGRLEAFYRRVFGPQDAFFSRLFARGLPAWYRVLLANLGLSQQHTLLALFLFLKRPELYLAWVYLTFLGVAFGYLYLVWCTPSPPSPPSSGDRAGGS